MIDTEGEMPLTNSSEDFEEQGLLPVEEANNATNTIFEVLETSDVDTAERSLCSRPTEEHGKRGEDIQNLATPSGEIDGAGVEEPEKVFSGICSFVRFMSF
ncbi:hypothetical protein C2S52_013754 [Perilla frutescens var. hirtella]|nr:hypothetical protein C2S52_013754 [Perilla frutescens var. hirtella]